MPPSICPSIFIQLLRQRLLPLAAGDIHGVRLRNEQLRIQTKLEKLTNIPITGNLENLAKLIIFWSEIMPKVSSTDLSNKLGQYQDEALKRPLIITKNNRDRLVMLSIEEYRRLKQLDRTALFVEELTDADLEAIRGAEVPIEHDHLNVEYEG